MSGRPHQPRSRLLLTTVLAASALVVGSVLPSSARQARDGGGASARAARSAEIAPASSTPASSGAAGAAGVAGAAETSCSVSAVAAGDFSTPLTNVKATGAQAVKLAPTYAVLLGDLQYLNGSLTAYRNGYATTPWANLNPIAKPTPGNHDYRTTNAAGYFSYFGVAPYYAYDLGCGWRAYSLNSEIDLSSQIAFVAADIAANPTKRLIAYWHKPVWSSGRHGNNPRFAKLIAAFGGRLEVAVWGHDHDYERGASGPLTWFVVGTGGTAEGTMPTTRTTGSKVAIDQVSGVLSLTFSTAGWAAKFIDTKGTIRDSASG